jgi:arabinan endo-1,5-alpha-L-arabinosidase
MHTVRNSRRTLLTSTLAGLFILTVAAVASAQQLSMKPVLESAESEQVLRYRFPSYYINPLTLTDPAGAPVVSCPDPAIIKQRVTFYDVWYLYCTGDPLNSNDKNSGGGLKNHLITQYKSYDLTHWTYIGDAFTTPPAWIGGVIDQLWAPAVKYFNNTYYLYYVAPNTSAGGPEIGVATSAGPAGPWADSGAPVVATEPAFCCPGSHRAVIDPDIIEDNTGQRYISYGSFFGGVSIRKLSADGLASDPTSETQLIIDNWAEGANWVKHDGWYYLLASTNTCCNGPATGYAVIAGRARSPLGPFYDKNGIALNTFAPGGTTVISASGNRWLGPGGNVVFDDDSGQAYMLYHAVDSTGPYFSGYPGFTRRPALIDPIDWIDEWPVVRGAQWASADRQPAPAAQPWRSNNYETQLATEYVPGQEIAALSDEFNSTTLSPQWHFIHPLADNTYRLTGSAYEVQTHGFDENGSPAAVSILGEAAPQGDYMVETKLSTSVSFNNSCCYNFAQGALFIYGDDQNSVKLDVFPNFDVRVTELGNQTGPVPLNYPTFGAMNIGPQGSPDTWLRIVKRQVNGFEIYSAYTSNDGVHWVRGGGWQHNLGAAAQIGISAQNAAGFTIDFDYIRVYRLKPTKSLPN